MGLGPGSGSRLREAGCSPRRASVWTGVQAFARRAPVRAGVQAFARRAPVWAGAQAFARRAPAGRGPRSSPGGTEPGVWVPPPGGGVFAPTGVRRTGVGPTGARLGRWSGDQPSHGSGAYPPVPAPYPPASGPDPQPLSPSPCGWGQSAASTQFPSTSTLRAWFTWSTATTSLWRLSETRTRKPSMPTRGPRTTRTRSPTFR